MGHPHQENYGKVTPSLSSAKSSKLGWIEPLTPNTRPSLISGVRPSPSSTRPPSSPQHQRKQPQFTTYEQKFLSVVDLSFLEDDGSVTFIELRLKRREYCKSLPLQLVEGQITEGFLEVLQVRSHGTILLMMPKPQLIVPYVGVQAKI